MNTFLRIGGWIVAVIAIVVAVVLGQKLQEARGLLDAAVHSNATLEAKVQDLTKLQEAAKSKSDEIEKTLEETTPTAETANAGEGGSEGNGAAALKALAQAAAGADPKKADDDPSNMFKGMADMFKGEKGKAMAKMSAGMQANMLYGPLFKDLSLPADVEERAMAVVSGHLETQMQAGLKMMSGEKIDPKQMGDAQKNAQKQLRDDLSNVLSADEMAKYDQYQEEMPRHALEQQYEIQLSMSSPSLKQESRDLIKQTLVEETLTSAPDFGKPGSDSSVNPASAFDAQLAAIDRARERLSAELDAEEFAQAERFLNQQQQQAQTMRDMMANMMGGDKKPDEAKPK